MYACRSVQLKRLVFNKKHAFSDGIISVETIEETAFHQCAKLTYRMRSSSLQRCSIISDGTIKFKENLRLDAEWLGFILSA